MGVIFSASVVVAPMDCGSYGFMYVFSYTVIYSIEVVIDNLKLLFQLLGSSKEAENYIYSIKIHSEDKVSTVEVQYLINNAE